MYDANRKGRFYQINPSKFHTVIVRTESYIEVLAV